MAEILDGKLTSQALKDQIAEEVKAFRAEGGKQPHLAAILVGEDGASQTYVNHKVKACDEVGFKSTLKRFPADISEEELLKVVEDINADDDIDGLIVQLPLPKHISVQKVTDRIVPEKDVDGFHPVNVGRMTKNLPSYISATPFGILKLIEHYNIDTFGKHCVVVGRSNIVGSPMSILMARNGKPGNATVTLCHRYTQGLEQYTRQADILIVAVGIPEFIKGDMVKEGAVVIDVGITRVEDASKKRGYVLKGDCEFSSCEEKASHITPVPGGVGPMTISSLLYNTLMSARNEVYQSDVLVK
ncbi:bifunctional methylenetetrahydrofolate dehydrogenase/methenyltetrahydrofolate cyclohydrolase FolD [Aureibacter tunicatorum]|uniref:Bifunctional protein FolD n=1 Tax=Aureibacter tunicatorum TaxID=866807 RepID=A0AAE4BT12_9BACT|nr:bifunctional methylenetetrahydrofolate dehydrogenase/methenyltetrahydrofolate cyclohydrolase FolD [Aureibacter tunicatorum]MDR6239383.1 methylenetetrahydrofolate dehydrogenase (NADP+)/methenyltetrahydrofolate cyclohydrolase [Aureibacter tunicatorum]BDD04694.1 bifunctional protein FolD [Aureibacter tunicatorum]